MDKSSIVKQLIRSSKCDAIIIPSSDSHKSEYLPDYNKIIKWFTGFSGSASTVVLTKETAELWTDSRYFIQAEKELYHPFVLRKLKTRTPEYVNSLLDKLPLNSSVGIDFELLSVSEAEYFTRVLKKKNISLYDTGDLFSAVWNDRPQKPLSKVFEHEESFCGMTRTEKITRLREYIDESRVTTLLVSALDDIAWILNMRGSDIECNPVFYGYLLISVDTVGLYIDKRKIDNILINKLKKVDVVVKDCQDIESDLENMTGTVEVDINTLNYKLFNIINGSCRVLKKSSITTKLKSVKTEKETEFYKKAQIRDGVSMCNFLYWLETSVESGDVTEVQAAQMIDRLRSKQENYIDLSFQTISAYGKNAALPHYQPDEVDSQKILPVGMYLVDSGAQYIDGTTDITRTVATGRVSEIEKHDFTLVLKGHIRVATAIFPEGTKGCHIDTLARVDLWKEGKDYGHGTGHGIGYFLNVHEGPQGFNSVNNTEIKAGMYITNEPGYYKEGEYGIRIENVLVCRRYPLKDNFLMFETITYCPLDKRLIVKSLLTKEEVEWVNKYHRKVYELISPYITDIRVKEWLKNATDTL